MYVVFKNDGVLDIRMIKMFGVSVKENHNPIGFFGTGLKYALAILLREDCNIKLLAGEETFDFSKGEIYVRGEKVAAALMNDEELPFTTHLGTNWELWQAFREIYCNTLDENGTIFLSDTIPKNTPGKTYFVVQGKKFVDLYHDRNKIVLNFPQAMLLHEGVNVDIYNKPSGHLYYRGIRVFDFDRPSTYTYNITSECTLTEDRTLKYPSIALCKLPKEVGRIRKREVITKILTAKECAEERFTYYDLKYDDQVVSEEFISVLGEQYHLNNDNLNQSAREYFKVRMNKNASKNYKNKELNEIEVKQLERACSVCRKIFDDFGEYEIKIVLTLGQETIALADRDNKLIVLSEQCFKMGTKALVGILIEEFLHLKTGYADMTRQFQDYLFQTITDISERHIIKEPI